MKEGMYMAFFRHYGGFDPRSRGHLWLSVWCAGSDKRPIYT